MSKPRVFRNPATNELFMLAEIAVEWVGAERQSKYCAVSLRYGGRWREASLDVANATYGLEEVKAEINVEVME